MVRSSGPWVVAIAATLPSVALAQPFGPAPEPQTPAQPTWEAPQGEVPGPEPTPPVLGPAQPPPPVVPASSPPPPSGLDEAPPAHLEAETAPERPDGFSVGVGLGWDLPSDLQLLDTASVRFRFRSGLTVEPTVTAAFAGSSFDWGDEDVEENSTSQMGLGANFRIPVKRHGPVDFLLVAGARVESLSTDPEGDENDTATDTVSIIWGLGVEYWLGPHVAISLTGTNPFAAYTNEWEEQEGDDANTSSWAAGLIFDPDVSLLVHVFL